MSCTFYCTERIYVKSPNQPPFYSIKSFLISRDPYNWMHQSSPRWLSTMPVAHNCIGFVRYRILYFLDINIIWLQLSFGFNSTRQADRAHARPNETKRRPPWAPPKLLCRMHHVVCICVLYSAQLWGCIWLLWQFTTFAVYLYIQVHRYCQHLLGPV